MNAGDCSGRWTSQCRKRKDVGLGHLAGDGLREAPTSVNEAGHRDDLAFREQLSQFGSADDDGKVEAICRHLALHSHLIAIERHTHAGAGLQRQGAAV